MKRLLRGSICLLLASTVPAVAGALAEDGAAPREPEQPRVADSSMANRIHGAWGEIRRLQKAERAAEADRRQREFAEEFFADFLEHPESTPGQQALSTAMRMWGNVGAVAEIERALARVDRGSSLWGHLLLSARAAYAANDRLVEFRQRVAALAEELTDAEARSELWILLGREYRAAGDAVRARDSFREVVDLGADAHLVEAAEAALREIDLLGEGKPAPEFKARSMSGETVGLFPLHGKVVLLEFWATTCAPCLPEIDNLKRIRSEFPREGLELIGIALDTDAGAVLRLIESKGIDWPQICDEQGFAGPLASLYNVRGLPRSFLLDRDGRIAFKDLRGDKLRTALRDLVGPTEPGGSGAEPIAED